MLSFPIVLTRSQVEHAVAIQRQVFELLNDLRLGLDSGRVGPQDAEDPAWLRDAALRWFATNSEAPHRASTSGEDDGDALANLFSSCVLTSFYVDASPVQRRYSALPFNPYDSQLITPSQVRPRKPDVAGKQHARRLVRGMLQAMAAELAPALSPAELAALQQTPALRDSLAIVTYVHDLLDRMHGVSRGTASLVLWRTFAWTPAGAPRRNFHLDTDLVLEAQAKVAQAVRDASDAHSSA